MTSKDASGGKKRNFHNLFSIAGGAIVVLGLCIAARSISKPESATAQAPVRQVAPTTRTAPAPATRPVAAAVSDNSQQIPKVMAVVNGQQITREELANECLQRYGKDVLESIVNKHLIWQACQKYNIAITDGDVENEIEQMASKFGLPKDRWLTMLERERDITADRYRREIIWPTLALRRLANEQIDVTEDELKKAFESEYGPKVKVRMISVSSRAKAEDIRKHALANPAKFGDLAKEFSEDANTAAARGIIPPIRKHIGYPEVEQTAFALKEGEISQVIPVANQHLILMCEKHLPESYVASTQMDQIQTQLRDQIRDGKLRTAATDIFKKLQDESQVVNVYNDARLQQQMPGIAATINGRQIPTQQLIDECLTRHGKEVLEGEINRRMLLQELQKHRKTVADAAVHEEIARAADSYGYVKADGSPDIDAWLKTVTENDSVTVELYVRDAVWPSVALKQLVGERVEVSDDDLQKGFESNYGERVEVLAIVLANQRQANEVWDMARHNPTEQFFGELASQYSIEPVSRANLGKVPPIRKFGGQPIVEEEAYKLQAGQLSGILNVGDKFVILRCQGRTKPVVQDFNAVKSELYKDIHEKKLRIAMADEFDRLKESAQIDNFLAGTSQSGRKIGATATRPANVSPAGFQGPATRR
ncbi:MAG: peptidylprolyl isomerase [Planctomycetaceae bacterium]|nr:peptidylprolyl isomerase [Planctomycetales bacterium]MCB9925694.1 peptidylprolyl isomerase [Planctomycetaceae bacterium]